MSDAERAIGRLEAEVDSLASLVSELRLEVRATRDLVSEVAGAMKAMRVMAGVFSTLAGVGGYFLHKIWRP
ncbi:hypothetical protein EOD42_23190 [Rhodovarius crocodyli]|uniref:DUF1515 domain-containing protein n=1 Tax=Rhodovarius crocodyli TaxID=1979269 RepID=A0A437LZ53_9PROT|nr:hypothetical protein [Rhodovarius crocodyli]RVT90709.1 hypothetical protein EOD42_23190 [Rhodovarius crocodyli]